MNAIRTEIIEIDLIDPDGYQWVTASIQKLTLDDDKNVISIGSKDDKLYRRIDKVATEMIVFNDPVTGKEITMSVAGLGIAIRNIMVDWMIEDNPNASLDKNTGLVLLDG